MSEVKACPWCGGQPEIFEEGNDMHSMIWIECRQPTCVIKAWTDNYESETEAIAAWNRREGVRDE